MAEINNSLAAQVNANPINLQSTLGTLANIDLAKAHAGLYGLQAQQEARKLQGFQYLQSHPGDYMGAIQQGLDPTVGSTMQGMGEKERAYGLTPQRISPESLQHYTGAQKNQAETALTGVKTQDARTELGGKIAQGVLADPSNDSVWANAVNQHYQTFGGPTLERQQLLAVKDPAQRRQIAAAYAGQAVPPGDFSKPHNVEPTAGVTTPGAILGSAAQPGGMMPGGGSIMGGGIVSGNVPSAPNATLGPSPNQRVGNAFGTIAPVLTPGQAAENKGYGEQLAKVLPVLADKADSSRQANFTLDQMRAESQSWPMGKGAQPWLAMQQYLKPIANGMGSTVFDKPVGDYESFQKNAGTLVRQAVKEVSSRAAVQEFQLIQKQLPSADMSRQGFNQIANQFQSVNDFNIVKHQAAQAWRDSRGTMDKFEADWNKNITPAAFMVARMPPDQIGALRANLSRTPEGRAALKSITRQIQWAHDNKLDQAVQ